MSTKKPARVQPTLFALYGGFETIPLHMPDAARVLKDKKTGKNRTVNIGKRPLDTNWTTRQYSTPSVIKRCIAEGRNMGVRMRATDLVIDVDPRNGGDDGLEDLLLDCGLDLSAYPRVITGSGGLHIYGTKPAGLAVVDTLPAYPGVEFKSKGRQVVSAGSVHPDTGKLYRFDPNYPDIYDLPEWPKSLLESIERPQRVSSVTGGGQYSQEQIARALDKLDPEDFRDHDEWLRLMMACHHASNGDAREEFVEWSTSDPSYADDAEIIGRRWDSLHAGRNDGVTYQTLNWILSEHGAADAIVAGDAAADFEDEDVPEDDSWLEGEDFEPSSDDDCGALERLNRTHCAVSAGGKYRIRYVEEDAVGKAWQQTSRQDFLALKESAPKLQTEGDKLISLGLAWQQWPHRRTAKGLTFDSKLPPASLDQYGNLNLWLGWTVPPKKGEWRKFKAMIRDDICDGDEKVFIYVVNWIAWKYQNPGELPKVAIAMRGSKGTGKGTFAEAVMRPFGNQAMATADYNLIAGRFTGHLEDKVMLFADEAFWAGDPRQESKIKKLITDRHTTYEDKGIKAYTGINRVGLIFATNEEWIVPAGEGERRYCVLRTSDRHQCPEGEPDHANRAYWDAIHAELENGGLAAFVHDMLNWPLPKGWHPQAHAPITKELANQKALSLRGVAAYYFEKLQAGALDASLHLDGPDVEWERGALHVRPTAVWEDARAWLHVTNPRAVITVKAVANELKKFGWQIADHQRLGKHRDRYWLCPDLKNARKRFNQVMRGDFF